MKPITVGIKCLLNQNRIDSHFEVMADRLGFVPGLALDHEKLNVAPILGMAEESVAYFMKKQTCRIRMEWIV